MHKRMIALAGSLLLATPLAQADIVGLGASVNYWDSDLSGTAMTDGDSVDIDRALRLDSDSSANASLYLEHPVPLLPNLRLNYTVVDQSGRGRLGASGFDTVPAGVDVRSDLDLEQLDLTLYYEILDNWVNLDLGLTVRNFSGDLEIRQLPAVPGAAVSRTSVDAVVPMLYLATRLDLPLTGVSVGGEGNLVSYDGDSMHDYNVYAQYQWALLRLRAGYRQLAVDYEDGDDQLDIRLDGPFVSFGVNF